MMRFAILLIVMHVVGLPALAQDRWDVHSSPISETAFKDAISGIGLPESEEMAADRAYARFVLSYERESHADQQRTAELAKLKLESDRANLDRELVCQWWDARVAMERRLESDVLAELSQENQRRAWSYAMRDIRRAQYVVIAHDWLRQRFAIDLGALLKTIPITSGERERLLDVVEAYAVVAEEQYQSFASQRNRLMRDTFLVGEDAKSRELRSAALDAWTKIREDARKPSDDFAPRIADALDAEHRTIFLDLVNRHLYPELYLPCIAEIAVNVLRMTQDVPREKREAVEAVFAEYLPRRDQLREQIIVVVRKWEGGAYPLNRELDELRASVEQDPALPDWRERQTSLLRQHPANPLLEKRYEMAIEAVHRMRAMFNDDDIARMPEAARIALTTW